MLDQFMALHKKSTPFATIARDGKGVKRNTVYCIHVPESEVKSNSRDYLSMTRKPGGGNYSYKTGNRFESVSFRAKRF